MLNMFIRSVIVYIFVLIVIRLMGKRQIGEMQPFELVITLIIADLACIPMAELAVPLAHGIVPIFTLLILHYFICLVARKSMIARYIISGRPAIVITPDGINYSEIKKLNMTLDDVIELIRGCEVFTIDDIAYAVIETNGRMCVVPKMQKIPVTREDLGIQAEQSAFPVSLIMDGKVMKENLRLTSVTEEQLSGFISKLNKEKFKDILLLTIDNNGKVFVQPKDGPYITFNIDYSGGNW